MDVDTVNICTNICTNNTIISNRTLYITVTNVYDKPRHVRESIYFLFLQFLPLYSRDFVATKCARSQCLGCEKLAVKSRHTIP